MEQLKVNADEVVMEISTFMRPHDDEQDLDISKTGTQNEKQLPGSPVESVNPQENVGEMGKISISKDDAL